MLTSLQSEGVTPEVNLGITGKKAYKGATLALKPMVDFTRSPKQGYQWPHEKDFKKRPCYTERLRLCSRIHRFFVAIFT